MNGSGPAKKKLFIAVGLGLVGLVCCAGLFWAFLVGWTVDTEAGDDKRGLTGEFVAEYFGQPELADGQTTIVRTRYLDGSYDVAIDFVGEDGTFFSTLYSVERSSSDALSVYGGFRMAGPLMGMVDDVDLQDRDDLFRWGDNASSKVIVVEGEPVGHVLVGREGNVAFMCTIGGLFFDDGGELQGLMAEVLASAQRDG